MIRIEKLPAAMIISLILLTSCAENKNQSTKASSKEQEVIPEDIVELREDQIKVATIEFGKIEMHTMRNTLKANGIVTVAPQLRASVCAPVGGFIRQIYLLPGEAVVKGQILATLENQEFVDIQFSYLEAKNKLAYAKSEFDRHTDLYRNDVYSEKNVQQVTVDYKNLQALTTSLEQKLIMMGVDPLKLREDNISNSIKLVSPIKGNITKANVNIGKNVTPQDVLFEIINIDKLSLELTLFEKDADKIRQGQKTRFYSNNESEEHEAVITQTGKSVGEDRTFKVYASVTSPCHNIFPGMYVNTVIDISEEEVTALPMDAIVTFNDKDYIFIFEKEKEENGQPFTEYRMIEVKKGTTDAGFTGVILPEGFDISNARVVIKGAYNLLSAKKNAGEMAC